MKKLTYFKLANCPYCKKADGWLSELMEENPEYRNIDIQIVFEDKETDLANSYDYYFVPSFFTGTEKLHEGAASKEIIKNVLDQCVS